MKEQRKNELLGTFPAVPEKYNLIMLQNKYAENFSIFLTNGRELFVRCFHKYSGKKVVIERQRYVFAKDGAVRYGIKYDDNGKIYWAALTKFREPVFASSYYGKGFNNDYSILNREAIEQSDMKYSCLSPSCNFPMEYLRLYCQHPNLEYLIKAGYESLISEEYYGFWGSNTKIYIYSGINWKSNNLLKMLNLNKTEFKLLQGKEKLYEKYIWWRNEFPKESPEHLIAAAEELGASFGVADGLMKLTGCKIFRIIKYLTEQKIGLFMYQDYLEQCNKLKYNLHDTAICFPHNFNAMHTRLSEIIKYEENEKKKQELISRLPERKKFEFLYNDLMLIQPKSMEEIIREGRILHHCVGGYAERHAEGDTNIFFIRKSSDPETPYFTIEVSNEFHIRQCHGYKNDVNGRPSEIDRFVEQYKKHLEELKNERDRNKRAV